MKALVISEDFEDSQKLEKIMKANFANVELLTASNAEETMNIAAGEGPLGFILINVDAKIFDPNALSLELLDFIGERPIIFFGSEGIFKRRISDDLYNRTKFNHTLFKPIERDNFVKEIREIAIKIKDWIKAEAADDKKPSGEINPDDYMQMKLKSFLLYNKFAYNVHMAITPTNYMMLIEANQQYTHTTLNQYAKKGVRHLYILKDDQLKFLETEANFCLRAMASPTARKDPNNMYLVHLRAITIFHQYLNSIGPTLLCTDLVEALVDSIIDQVVEMGSFKELLKGHPAGYAGIASKSLLTAYFTLKLAAALEWDSDSTKLKLVFSSILQDYYLPEDELTWIIDKEDPRLVEYDLDTNTMFLEHPIKAARMAAQFSKFSDTDFVLANHHEIPNREGFPNRPSLTSLTQINAVFNISQAIASKIDGEPMKQETLVKAWKSIQTDFGIGLFKEPLKKMGEIFKFN